MACLRIPVGQRAGRLVHHAVRNDVSASLRLGLRLLLCAFVLHSADAATPSATVSRPRPQTDCLPLLTQNPPAQARYEECRLRNFQNTARNALDAKDWKLWEFTEVTAAALGDTGAARRLCEAWKSGTVAYADQTLALPVLVKAGSAGTRDCASVTAASEKHPSSIGETTVAAATADESGAPGANSTSVPGSPGPAASRVAGMPPAASAAASGSASPAVDCGHLPQVDATHDAATVMSQLKALIYDGGPSGQAVRWCAPVALGRVYALGQGIPVDETDASRWFLVAAERGMPEAQQLMGWRFLKGVGVAVNNDKAMLWLRRAADSGLAPARTLLGLQLLGAGTMKPDLAAGAGWIVKAAEQGYGPAQQILGSLYDSGSGVPHDADKARTWWRKGADQGLAGAKFLLGRSLLADDVDGQRAEAIGWIRSAAAQGDADAKAWMDDYNAQEFGRKNYQRIKAAAAHENNRTAARPTPYAALLQLWDSGLQAEASRKAQVAQLQPVVGLLKSPLAQVFGGSSPLMQAHLDADRDLYTLVDLRYVNGYPKGDHYVVLAEVSFRHGHDAGQARVEGHFTRTELGWALLAGGIDDRALGLGLPPVSTAHIDGPTFDHSADADDRFMEDLFISEMWGD